MPDYFDATGRKVTQAEACIAGSRRLRDGFKSVLREGEYLGFDMAFMDAKPSASVFLTDAGKDAPNSIDAALKAHVEQMAKGQNLKPSEYLAGMKPQDVEKMIADIAGKFVREAGGAGIASAFSFDHAAAAIRALVDAEVRLATSDAEVQRKVSEMRAAHDRKHAFLGDRAPPFDADTAATVARAKVDNGQRSVRDAVRDASFR